MSRTTRIVAKNPARGANGMVVSHNRESAEIGADVLRKGGTAFDAAVAMGFATAVREFAWNSIGGVGVLLAHSADTQTTSELNFYGQTPAGLAEDTFVEHIIHDPDPSTRSRMGFKGVANHAADRGFLSVGVPTYISGIAALHDAHGTMSWRELLQPAVDLARDGFSADDEDTFLFATHLQHLQRYKEIERIYLSTGIPMPGDMYQGPGHVVAQPDLAATIAAVADDGPDVFYRGRIGKTIADHIQSEGGVLSTDDLAEYAPDVADGTRSTYRGYEVVTSSGIAGGITLVEMLNIAEHFDLGSLDRYSGQCLHLIAEIQRQAWTDRFVYVGDPAAGPVPIDALTSKRYAETVVPHIPTDRVPRQTQPGDPWPHSRHSRPASMSAYAGDPSSSDTTHLATADGYGNVVTLTQTLGLAFGSCVTVPTTGVTLVDVTCLMNPVPGTPNSVGPRKKPAGHPTPTMLLKDGQPILAIGAPGGRRVVSAMFQIIVNVVDFGMDVQEAIGAPRLHCEGATPSDPVGPVDTLVLVDDRVPAESLEDLRGRGHHVHPVYETGSQKRLARPLGIQRNGDELLGGVDVFGRSVGIGI